MYPLLITGGGALLCAVILLSLDPRLVVQPPSGTLLVTLAEDGVLWGNLAWHYQMPWLETAHSTPVHNPVARAGCWALPSADGQRPCAQKSEGWKCLTCTLNGHYSTLQSSISQCTSSRSCFMFAVLNASLTMHIRQY